MATRTIPAKTVTTCDRCDRQCGDDVPRQMEGVIKLEGHALDYLGSPAANASSRFELCDDCYTMLASLIGGEIRAGTRNT